MKKILSILLLASLLLTAVLPASAATAAPTEIEQPPRDDVLILFDGGYEDTKNLTLQYSYANPLQLTQDNEFYLQGSSSMMVNMPDSAGRFEQQDFVFGLILTLEEIVSIKDFPISELSLYNHMDTKDGDRIQINYVDPDNEYGHLDDSYNKDFEVANLEPGWNLLQHDVMSSALYSSGLNPDNIDHVRFAWRTDKENYTEVDWSFDCLIIAKQSFYDDRATAQEQMNRLIAALEIPTVETMAQLEESIVTAKEKMDDFLYEFPNFMVEDAAKLEEVWETYLEIKAESVAADLVAKIDALGEITTENYESKKADVESVVAEYDAYIEEGYKESLITNLDKLESAISAVKVLELSAAIDALPAVDALTEADAEKVNEVKTALAALDAEQRSLIPQEKKDKVSALTAKIVENAITALPAVDALTLEDEESLTAARTALDALATAAKALVDQEAIDKLTALEAKMDELKNPYTLGDINGDDDINASDALLALQHSVKLTTLVDADFDAANVDGSDAVDATDALYILQYSVKLIDKFPASKSN